MSEVSDARERLERRSYSTYCARLKAAERLNKRNTAWNASMISAATSTTLASVGLLLEPRMYGRHGDALMVVLAIVSLVASMVVSGMNYGARAQAMQANYRKMQEVSVLAEGFFVKHDANDGDALASLFADYLALLEPSENHSHADHLRATGCSWRDVWRDDLVNLMPYVSLVGPVLLAIPLIRWFMG